MVSFPQKGTFTSHIAPYNHEHATVGLNAPPEGFSAVHAESFSFSVNSQIFAEAAEPYDREQAGKARQGRAR